MTDLAQWPVTLAETFALAEPQDRSKRGLSGDYDQVHLGVGAAGFGNVNQKSAIETLPPFGCSFAASKSGVSTCRVFDISLGSAG
jgi:hypothetical protein